MNIRPKLNVALIGAGLIARDEHLPAWGECALAEVVAVADPSESALAAVAREFSVARRVPDYRRLLDDPAIDVVDVCLPSGLHAEVTIAALAAGKHVLCQKPMATSHADAAAVLDAWRRSGKQLMIAQQLRFEPAVVQLKAYLDRHPLGDVYYARGQWLRRRRVPARPGFTEKRLSGGGPLYDLGVHVLDLAWWLMGCPPPATVSGATYNHLARRPDLRGEWGPWDAAKIDVEDFAAGLIRFRSGATLSLEVSWLGLQPEPEFWRLQLYGTRAGAIWPDGIISGETEGIPWDVKLGSTKGPKAHHAVIHHFAAAVVAGTPPLVTPEQSAGTIALLDALYRSAKLGHEVEVRGFATPA